ncbi:MAG TPA: methyltransferase domain-containing protein [Nitrolancea sp.]|nr:methyltransferase domain-containing protein [Nitrolancea sp.]
MLPQTIPASRPSDPFTASARWQREAIAQRHAEASAYLEDVFATPALRDIAAHTLALLALTPGEAVLEVGCGTGVFLPLLARAVGPAGRVVGLDLAPTFVAAARARIAAQGCAGAVTVEEGDAYRLPFPDASFDAAHCERVLMHLDDPTAVLREMRRVVRPGGRVLAVEPDWAGCRLDHPDGAALDLLRARSLGQRQPDAGLTLYRRLADAGLIGREVVPHPVPLTDLATLRLYGFTLQPGAAALVAEGQLTRERAETALAYLDEASAAGTFFACVTAFIGLGRVPAP